MVNKVCVGTCSSNLVLSAGECNYCPNSGFKLISDSSCLSVCPDYFYGDSSQFLCAQCDGSCLTCSGGYA